jgi:hypothetical protein
MAGYFGENFIAGTPPTAANGVRRATATELGIFGTFEGAPPSQLYFFCWRAADRTLRMRRGDPTLAGNYACDTNAEVLARDIVNLRFTYIDQNNNPMASPLDGDNAVPPTLAVTTQRNALRAIRIFMQTQEDVQNAGHGQQILTLTTTIMLRNFVFN